jgi:ABC-type uncharacterized transport system permease subunit
MTPKSGAVNGTITGILLNYIYLLLIVCNVFFDS